VPRHRLQVQLRAVLAPPALAPPALCCAAASPSLTGVSRAPGAGARIFGRPSCRRAGGGEGGGEGEDHAGVRACAPALAQGGRGGGSCRGACMCPSPRPGCRCSARRMHAPTSPACPQGLAPAGAAHPRWRSFPPATPAPPARTARCCWRGCCCWHCHRCNHPAGRPPPHGRPPRRCRRPRQRPQPAHAGTAGSGRRAWPATTPAAAC